LLVGSGEHRVIPAPVLVELDQLVASRWRPESFLEFLSDVIEGAYEVVELQGEDYARARDLCHQYSDAKIGFVDASIVAIAERLNEPRIATLDHRHFRIIRPRHVDAFQLLPDYP
jgi:hypothetical protein